MLDWGNGKVIPFEGLDKRIQFLEGGLLDWVLTGMMGRTARKKFWKIYENLRSMLISLRQVLKGGTISLAHYNNPRKQLTLTRRQPDRLRGG